MTRRALVVADLPTHFQNTFFDAVATRGDVEIEVWFCRSKVAKRVTTGEGPARAPFRMLPRIPLGGATVNPTLLARLIAARDRVAVVIGYYTPGLASACLALGCTSRPWVFWTDTLPAPPPRTTSARQVAHKAALGWCLRRSTVCLTTGEAGRRSLALHGVPDHRIFSLPFVVDQRSVGVATDDARARRRELRAELGLNPLERVVLFVGQMIERKGVDILLRAHALAAQTGHAPRLVLLGAGPDQQRFQQLASSLGVSPAPVFLPPRPNHRLPEAFAVADVLALPSRFDAWPVIVVEALAAGLPVLGSDACGSVRDGIVEGENGWLLPAGDEAALARALAMVFALEDAQLQRMSVRARASVARWSADEAARDFTNVIENAYSQGGRGDR
jgi:glycosyltransferase involved in cell wall biosynthesis